MEGWIYVFIFGLFDKAVNTLQYVALNGEMMKNSELGRMW